MNLKLTRLSQKKVKLKRMIFFSFFLILPTFPFLPSGGMSIGSIIVGSYLMIWALANMISGFMISSYDFIGELELNSDSIKVKGDFFELCDIRRLNVDIKSFHGDSQKGALVGVGSLYVKEGADNKFTIITHAGIRKEFTFYIKYYKNIIAIKQYLYHYKNNKDIDIYLKMNNKEVKDIKPRVNMNRRRRK